MIHDYEHIFMMNIYDVKDKIGWHK